MPTSPPASRSGRSPVGPAHPYDFTTLGPAHRAVVGRVPRGSRVLELGCATGYLTRALLERGCAVVAVDNDAAALSRARGTGVTALLLDLEHAAALVELTPYGPYDVIVCADVLEHLRDPTGVLAALAALLRPGGSVVVSLPNVGFWRNRLALLRGRWDYTDQGILDRTHLRFFTPATARVMATDAGLEVHAEQAVSESFPFARLFPGPLRWVKHRIDGVLVRLVRDPFTYQVVLDLRQRL